MVVTRDIKDVESYDNKLTNLYKNLDSITERSILDIRTPKKKRY